MNSTVPNRLRRILQTQFICSRYSLSTKIPQDNRCLNQTTSARLQTKARQNNFQVLTSSLFTKSITHHGNSCDNDYATKIMTWILNPMRTTTGCTRQIPSTTYNSEHLIAYKLGTNGEPKRKSKTARVILPLLKGALSWGLYFRMHSCPVQGSWRQANVTKASKGMLKVINTIS